MLREILITPCFNEKLKDYVLVLPKNSKRTFIIKRNDWIDLAVEAGERFDTFAPLAMTERLLSSVWSCNNTVYKWIIKRVEQLDSIYRKQLDDLIEKI